MDYKGLKKLAGRSLVLAAVLLGASALVMLALTSQDSEQFGRTHDMLLLINGIGAFVLLLLIASNLFRLVRDYRTGKAGARLKTRMLLAFVTLAVAPLVIVWYFAVQFLNQGIDSWFDVRVEQGLGDALELSRSALDVRMREDLEKTRLAAVQIDGARPTQLVNLLGDLRREAGATEITVFGNGSRIMATSTSDPAALFPSPPPEDMSLRLRRSGSYVTLEPGVAGRYQVRAAVVLRPRAPGAETFVVQGLYPVGGRIGMLADSVEQSYRRYRELAFLREPLRYSFTITLTLVVLCCFLAALYGGVFFTRRLVAPLQSLVAGTQAVARGDLDTRLPIATHDEVGFLIDSFNEMILRLKNAREAARWSQQQVEEERAQLAVILARLTTGVIALEADGSIRTANEAAGVILGADLVRSEGHLLDELAEKHPLVAQFVDTLRAHGETEGHEWRHELELRTDAGRRTLVCACTSLPVDETGAAGEVIVFDDVTNLVRAQRDAAWGEVARRLAHEIKNPLTPIQLSAERIRRRYLKKVDVADAEVLDRATHTIVQQVEAMRDMVNAFSEYARVPALSLTVVDLNQLVREVSYLYPAREGFPTVSLELDPGVGEVAADVVRMRQVLHNLIRNALEALDGRSDGRVTVATGVTDTGDVELVISDNGPGLDPETLDKIFEPYVTTKAKGTGLGLAIVKKLVEEHGGSVTAENVATGGAKVHVRLPCRQFKEETENESRRQQQRRREHA
ncbi:MAG: HAMP domain-containing protein [Chromatiales bacterium]|nr:MAG: HAMP domain-containing protein [Chromatiales bacterium]